MADSIWYLVGHFEGGIIAYCPIWMHSAAWMHTASECILPPNAYCL